MWLIGWELDRGLAPFSAEPIRLVRRHNAGLFDRDQIPGAEQLTLFAAVPPAFQKSRRSAAHDAVSVHLSHSMLEVCSLGGSILTRSGQNPGPRAESSGTGHDSLLDYFGRASSTLLVIWRLALASADDVRKCTTRITLLRPLLSAISVSQRRTNRCKFRPANGGRDGWFCVAPNAARFQIGRSL
jgi:hypothetical protein